jgi:hypothetical protein
LVQKFLLCRISDDTIINLENVTRIQKINDNKVWIYFMGEENSLKVEGYEARAVWTYFYSAVVNYRGEGV